MEPQTEANLEDYEEIRRWLLGKSEGSKYTYLSGMKAFIEFTKMNPEQLIDLAEADRQKSRRERGEPERLVLSFFEWLRKSYVQKSRGGKRLNQQKTGISRNLASGYCTAIRSFYKANGFPLILKLPKAANKKENFKLIIRTPEVKRLLDVATNIRDRAIILTIFQGGMSISELCNLTYGDLAKGLEENKKPLHLHLIRKKELVEYDTFLGSDAIERIKSYLDERKRNGEILRHDLPLFVKRFTKTGAKSVKIQKISPTLVESSFRSLAIKSGLVNKEQMEKADINPCRPHALRTAFISILKTAGMNNTAVEYMAGHTLSENDRAYWAVRVGELRSIYVKYQKFLSVSGMVDTEKLELLEQKTKRREELIEVLLENGKLKDRKITELTKRINQFQGDLEFYKMEQITRFVRAKAPTRKEFEDYLRKRHINKSILKRLELNCIFYDKENGRYIYSPENDTYKLGF